MRRLSVAFPLLLALLLSLVATSLAPARAQDAATPAAEDEGFPLPEGVSVEFLAFGFATDLPGVGEIALFRFTFEPGSAFPLDPNDPSTALVVVEEGELTFELEAAVTVVRAGEDGQFPTEFEEVTAGEELTLEVGDSLTVPGNVAGEVRNDGDEEAVLLISNIAPSEGEKDDSADEAARDLDEDGATPTSGDTAGDADGDTADASATAVEIVDFSYRSDTVEIAAGTTVTWTNNDTVPHTATADDGSFDSGSLGKGDSFSHTFDEPGTYPYFCAFHTGMRGTIVVT